MKIEEMNSHFRYAWYISFILVLLLAGGLFTSIAQAKKKAAVVATDSDYEAPLLTDPKANTQAVMEDLEAQLDRLNHQALKCIDNSRATKNIYPVVTLPGTKSGDLSVSVLTLAQMQSLFQEIANDPTIPFKYPEDGCNARAHYMARLLEKKGIRVAKAFTEGNLVAPQTVSPQYTWNHHVTVSVAVRQPNGKIEMMVIDPILFNRPATVKEWVAKQTQPKGPAPKMYFTERFNYLELGNDEKNMDLHVGKWKRSDTDNQDFTLNRIRLLQEDRLKGIEYPPDEEQQNVW